MRGVTWKCSRQGLSCHCCLANRKNLFFGSSPFGEHLVSEFALSNLPTLVTQAAASITVSAPSTDPSKETVGTTDQITLKTEELKVDLRQALNFVIEDESEKVDLSDDEVSAVEQRRLDLIMWLLNLELRLSPYTADFA